jgi:hypothetical protein
MVKQEVTEVMDINVIDIQKAEFYLSANGIVGLRYLDKDYKRVILSRILPLNNPNEYISVMDTENKEIGIIISTDEMCGEQAEIVRSELAKRYYCPVILKIKAVKEKMGYVYFDISIKGRSRNFAVKDVSRNIRQIGDQRIMIFDVDGNRYLIEDASAMDKKSLRLIEPYLF